MTEEVEKTDAELAAFVEAVERELTPSKEEMAQWARGIREFLVEQMISKRDYKYLIWIDVESSGLHADSFPIEVGWCSVDLIPVSFLIKPIPGRWTIYEWSLSSERVHGIGWNTLQQCGRDVHDVANWLNAATAGKIVLSDNPEFDAAWLRQLYFDTGIEQEFELLDAVHAAGVAAGLSSLTQPDAQAILARIHSRYPHPHRAGPDSRRSAAEFLAMAMPSEIDEILAKA